MIPSDEELARILGRVPTAVYVYDAQSRAVVYESRSLRTLLGFEETAATTGAPDWRANIHPDDAGAFAQHLDRVLRQPLGAGSTCEVRLRDSAGTWRWFLLSDTAASGSGGEPGWIAGSATEISRQKQSERLAALTVGEMRHRTKNLAAIFDAIGRQSVKGEAQAVQEFFERFMGRIRAVLGAGSIVLASDNRAADLKRIVDAALTPFRDVGRNENIEIAGPDVSVSELTAGGLSLAVHELATNALKYGALSVPDGKVRVHWTLQAMPDGSATLALVWQESGGPPVAGPKQEGFGTKVIRSAVRHEMNGETRLAYARDGLRCEFRFSLPAAPPP